MVKSDHLASSKLSSSLYESLNAYSPQVKADKSTHRSGQAHCPTLLSDVTWHNFVDMTTAVRGQARNATTRYASTGTGGRRKTRATKLSFFMIHRNHRRARSHFNAGRPRTKASRPRPRHPRRPQTTTARRPQPALLWETKSPSLDQNPKAPP